MLKKHQALQAGKVAIVTGGSSGIGRAVCCALAAAGVSLVVVGRDQTRLAAALNVIRKAAGVHDDPARIVGMALDVTCENDMIAMADETVNRFGRIDMLIASAGILRPHDTRPNALAHIPVLDWDTVLDTNLKGVFLSNRSVLETMIRQRCGLIINIASLSGRRALPLDAPYCPAEG